MRLIFVQSIFRHLLWFGTVAPALAQDCAGPGAPGGGASGRRFASELILHVVADKGHCTAFKIHLS